MLGSIAEGTTHVEGFLEGEDALATLNAFRAMGVEIEGPQNGKVTVHGVGYHPFVVRLDGGPKLYRHHEW
jgi:3-phosphoshikimate 1-carboxyvinyltransferase